MKIQVFTLAAIAAFAGVNNAQAQDWNSGVELGYVSTSGNSEDSSLKFRANTEYKKEQWVYTAGFDALNAESNGQRSSENYFFSNRLRYNYSDTNYAFAYASYDDDRFSGYDYQATAALGYGRRLLNSDSQQWDAEIGPGYRVGEFADGSSSEDEKEAILRLFTQYSAKISENASFSQEVTVEGGDDNTVSKSVSALKTAVVGNIALSLSYTVKYTENVPNGIKHADKETAVTLVYKF